MCYKDKVFCTFGILCKNSLSCDRVLTKEITQEAEVWWGKPGAPICVYSEFPECFIRFFEIEVI
jgi:hypothetical protein